MLLVLYIAVYHVTETSFIESLFNCSLYCFSQLWSLVSWASTWVREDFLVEARSNSCGFHF